MKSIFLFSILTLTLLQCQTPPQTMKTEKSQSETPRNQETTEAQWKAILSPEEYKVLREKGTEAPFSGQYDVFFEKGEYRCKACGEPLFSSEAKFDSHCGWPSFDEGIAKGKIIEKLDTSHGMVRTEILCANCGSHLGHVFTDGPTETGLRYCVNSISLDFEPQDSQNKSNNNKTQNHD